MRKRRLYLGLLLLAVAVAVGVIVKSVFREREPEYGGRRLSEWVRGYMVVDQSGLRSRESDEAIHHIGTNAIPYLLKWIRYERPTWKEKLGAILGSLNASWQFPDDHEKQLLADGAENALCELKPEGKWAVAELTQLLRPNAPFGFGSAARAESVLAQIGDAGLRPLLAVITNKQTTADRKTMVLFRMGMVEGKSGNGVPALLYSIKYGSDWSWKDFATNALRAIDPRALEEARKKVE